MPFNGYWGKILRIDLTNSRISEQDLSPEEAKNWIGGVVATGKSDEPAYAWIHEGHAELRDASHLWGRDTFETEDAIKNELGDQKIQVAPIGRAGESLVRYAGLICNHGHGCAGRTGMGAVMGSQRRQTGQKKAQFLQSIRDFRHAKHLRRQALGLFVPFPFSSWHPQSSQNGLLA